MKLKMVEAATVGVVTIWSTPSAPPTTTTTNGCVSLYTFVGTGATFFFPTSNSHYFFKFSSIGFLNQELFDDPRAGLNDRADLIFEAEYGARSRRVAVQRTLHCWTGTHRVVVNITGDAASGWGLSVVANGRSITDFTNLYEGCTIALRVRVINFQPPVKGVRTRVIVYGDWGRLTVTQRWNDRTSAPLDFLNFELTLTQPLQPPWIPHLAAMRFSFAARAAATHPSRAALNKLQKPSVAVPIKQRSAPAAAASRGWSIRASAAAPAAATATAAGAAEESTLVQACSLSHTLDLELTAEEAQCIAQPQPVADAWSSSPAAAAPPASAASLASPRVLLRRASASLRHLRGRLAAAACLARPASVAE
ncbi:hypothetical protein ABPG75_004557 [Micractinium tetrahymenae]